MRLRTNHAICLVTSAALAAPALAQWSESTMPSPQGFADGTVVGDYLIYAGGAAAGGLVQVFDTST